MDLLMEIILEFILEGCGEIVQCKKVPLPLRILAGTVLMGVIGAFLWLSVCLLVNGIREMNWILALVGAGMVMLVILLAVALVREWRHRNRFAEKEKSDEKKN